MPKVPALLSCHANCIISGTIFSSCEDNLKQGGHDSFSHVTPFVFVSAAHDANDIISGSIAFLGQNHWNEVQHDSLALWCHWHQCQLPPSVLVSCDTICPHMMPQHFQWHHCIPLGQDYQNEVQHDIFGHVKPLMPVSHHAGISVMWHQHHFQWHHCIP